MPTFKDKSGKSRFAMNPQQGSSLIGGPDTSVPGLDAAGPDATADDDHVELHHGGNPQGQPPPTETTQYHTIHKAEIQNHDDYDSADQRMKECMGEPGDMGGDMGGGESGSDGGEY